MHCQAISRSLLRSQPILGSENEKIPFYHLISSEIVEDVSFFKIDKYSLFVLKSFLSNESSSNPYTFDTLLTGMLLITGLFLKLDYLYEGVTIMLENLHLIQIQDVFLYFI